MLLLEVETLELNKIVIPKIKTHWNELAYAMKYNIREVEIFDKEGRYLHERCEKLFENWLETGHGPTPKTYLTLLEHIRKIDKLTAASEEIERELIKGKDK